MGTQKLISKLISWADKRDKQKLDSTLLREAAFQLTEMNRLIKMYQQEKKDDYSGTSQTIRPFNMG